MGRDTSEATEPPFAALGEDQRREAVARLAALRPALEDEVPLSRAADEAGVPLRTAQRWLARYRRDGLVGLARPTRRDAGRRRPRPELVALVEGLGLRRPRRSAAAIHRWAAEAARAEGWPVQPRPPCMRSSSPSIRPWSPWRRTGPPPSATAIWVGPPPPGRGDERSLAGRPHAARRLRPALTFRRAPSRTSTAARGAGCRATRDPATIPNAELKAISGRLNATPCLSPGGPPQLGGCISGGACPSAGREPDRRCPLP